MTTDTRPNGRRRLRSEAPDTDGEALMDSIEQIQDQINREQAKQERQVDPQVVINLYRQRCADLEFELYKAQALLAAQDQQVSALHAEVANLRAMHTDHQEEPA